MRTNLVNASGRLIGVVAMGTTDWTPFSAGGRVPGAFVGRGNLLAVLLAEVEPCRT